MSGRLAALGVILWLAVSGPTALAAEASGNDEAKFDYNRLGHPEVSSRLDLSDQQIAGINTLINERAVALSEASEQEQAAISAEYDQKLAALLTEPQRAKLLELPSQQPLRFSFQNQKWQDVLDWFARQADLSLVVDKVPEGSFNYTDSRSYTPSQAIDLLNSVLSTKGFTLIRRERMLICANLASGLPETLIPTVHVRELDKYGSHEFVRVMFPLGSRPAQSVLEEIQPLLGPFGKAAALPQTKQLIVTDTAGKMRAISIVIASIPEPKAAPKPETKKPAPKPKPELQVYSVDGIDPAAAVDTLKSLLPDAKFSVDVTANQISAFATPSQQKAVKSAIDQMMANASPDKQPSMQVYPLKGDNVSELEEQVRLAVPNVELRLDREKKRLLVIGGPRDQTRVKATLETLQAAADAGVKRQAVVYRVTNADVGRVVDMLQELVPEGQFTSDSATGRIVALADTNDHLTIRQLIEQLDPRVGDADAPVLQVHAVPRPAPEQLLDTLKAIVPRARINLQASGHRMTVIAAPRDQRLIKDTLNQLESIERDEQPNVLQIHAVTAAQRRRFDSLLGTLTADFPGMRVVQGGRPEELMIWARPNQHAELTTLLKSLEHQPAEDERQLLVPYTLQHRQPTQVQEFLQQLHPDNRTIPDPQSRRLLVWGRAQDHVKIKADIEQLDQPESRENEPALQLYEAPRPTPPQLLESLKAIAPQANIVMTNNSTQLSIVASPRDHQRIVKTLKEFQSKRISHEASTLRIYPVTREQRKRFDAVIEHVQRDLPGIEVIGETPPGELAIWALPSQHESLKTLLETLRRDVGADEQQQLASYPLQHGDPTSLAEMLRELFPDTKIVPDKKSGRVLIWARPEEQVRLKHSIEQLDSPNQSGAIETLASYPVGGNDAEQLVEALRELVPDMKLVGDRRADAIFAWGTAKDHQTLRAALKQMREGDPGEKRTTVVYPIGSRDAQDVRELLRSIAPQARIVADVQGRSVVASATEGEHEALRATVSQLSKQGDGQQRSVAVYSLERASAEDAVKALQALVPEALLTVSKQSNQIIGWATAAEHDRVRTAVEQMESERLADRGLVLQVYPVKDELLDNVSSVLQKALPRAEISTSNDRQKLIIWARPTEHESTRSIIQTLQAELEGESDRSLRVYSLDKVVPRTARQILDDSQRGLQYIDSGNPKTLLIRARTDQHESIARFLEELEQMSPERPATSVEVYPLEDHDPDQVRQALDPSLTENISITTDAKDGSLIVRATHERHARLKTAIKQVLEKLPKIQAPITTVYPLKNSDPEAARTVLGNAVPGAQLVVEPSTHSLVVTASAEDHQRVQQTLKQMDELSGRSLETRVYPLDQGDPDAVQTVLRRLLPDATIAIDDHSRAIVATARPEEHEQINQAVSQLSQANDRETEAQVYRLRTADPDNVREVLSQLLPRATIVADDESRTILATASQDEHERIRQTVDQLDQTVNGDVETRVYRLKSGDPDAARAVLEKLLPDATLVADRALKTLLATASTEDHAHIQQTVTQMDREDQQRHITRVYQLGDGNPESARRVLESLLPLATFASDSELGTLLATADPADQERIKEVVQQLDSTDSNQSVLRPYVIRDADAEAVHQLLRSLYERNRRVSLSLDANTDTVMALATPREHLQIAKLVAEMENSAGLAGQALLQLYPLKNIDSQSVVPAIESLLAGEKPSVSFNVEPTSNQLMVVALPEQHAKIRVALQGLRGQERMLEAFQLQVVDPLVVQSAIENLYAESETAASIPTVDADPSTQQLFVRGTQEQIDRIRGLLQKMGEPNFGSSEQSRTTRVIPLGADAVTVLKQIQLVWPRLRGNPIEVVNPVPSDPQGPVSLVPGPTPVVPPEDRRDDTSAGDKTTDEGDGEDGTDEENTRGLGKAPATGASNETIVKPAVNHEAVREEDNTTDPSPSDQATSAPLYVVPAEDRMTVASTDTEALDQFEALVRALTSSPRHTGAAGSFSVFTLRNAGASQLARMLNDLVRRIPFTSQGSLGRVVVVADNRMNALIIHGTRTDRSMVESLLKILDSSNVPESLGADRPEIIHVKYAEASDIVTVLKSVYKTQMTSGGNRPEIDIPEGVSSEVASVLQQINAATSGPLLTLEVDDLTNSIVVLAPLQLREQVAQLIDRLDNNSRRDASKGVSIIALQKMSSKRLEQALDVLLKRRD